MKKSLFLFYLITILSLIACQNDDGPLDTDIGPLAEIKFSPEEPIIGEEINFQGEQLTGSSEIIDWHWEFKDSNSSTSDVQNPNFIYDLEGTYEVLLEVSDGSQDYYTTMSIKVLGEPEMASIIWEHSTGATVKGINDGSSAPVIDESGVIYYVESRVGAESKIVAVNDEGETASLKWASSEIGAELPNSPSIGPDGNILINAWSKDRAINKINAQDGTLVWSGATGADQSNSTPVVDSEGNVYHSTRLTGGVGGMYAWDINGNLKWHTTGNNSMYAAPALSSDEKTVYFLDTGSGQVRAINTEDGTDKWTEPVGPGGGRHGSSLSIDKDGTIYFTNEAYIVALRDEESQGSIKWQLEADAAQSGVVIGSAGELFVGSVNGLLSLDSETGNINWVYSGASIVESVPAVDSNGIVYAGTEDGRLIMVNPEGELELELKLGTGVVNSPTIAEDGTVFVEAFDDDQIKLYKIAVENSSGPSDSSWPMKGQNIRSTGVAK